MQKILVALVAAVALVVAAPVASAASASLPAHDTSMVTCARNAITGMGEVHTAAPTMLGTRSSSETVGYLPQLMRWNGAAWVLHRNGSWMTSTTTAGGHVFGGPLFRSGQTFGPLGSGYYAVRINFWWSSTGVVHAAYANEYNGYVASYCQL
jgi:hypothetical protein